MKWKGEYNERGIKDVWGLEDFAVVGLMVFIVLIFTYVLLGPIFVAIGHL